MSTKWTREEFEAKKKALEDRKRKKNKLKGNMDTILGTVATMGVSSILYKVADITY